jgi:predicted nuclease of predicted toxin-antitoxin system
VIRLHLDENVHISIAEALIARGYDVTTAASTELRESSDEEHLVFALREGRVIFTHDQDFLRLHASGVEHAGIAFCRQNDRTIGEIIRLLSLLAECVTADEIRGRVEYL